MKETVKDVCSICNQPFKHSSIKIKLLSDLKPRRIITDSHSHCRKVRAMFCDYYR
jgi:hypothetical protein